MGSYLHILIAAIFCTSFLSAEVAVKRLISRDQIVQVLGGGWDHNANNQPELLALHQPVDSLALSEVVYYEDAGVDTLAVLWHHRLGAGTPAYIVDAGVTDLDGDRLPEIAVLLHYQTLEDKSAPYWLEVFDWSSETGTFSTEPTSRWNYRGRGISYLRPRQMVVADLDVDGNDELVIAMGSPDRMVLIADWGPTGLQVYKELRNREMISGPWPFNVAVADLNGDLRMDILIVGQGQTPEMLAYINGLGDFHATSVTTTVSEPVLPAISATGDLNGDGQEEIILPHTDGSLTLVSLAGPALRGVALDTEIPNLLDLAAVDLDGDDASEIVYLLAGGTVTTNDTRFVTPVTREQLLSRLPDGVAPPLRYQSFAVLPASVKSPPVIVLPVHTETGSFVALTEIGEPLSRQLPLPPYEVTRVTEPEPITGLGKGER
ncbi:MAG: VCBS repeat-containing protein, partial [Candidatus Neomarinimicrobiota bacterium]